MAAELRLFPPFRLDSHNEQLWRGSEEIRLRRKTFAVLRHLVERPGQLVTKAALLDAVWPDVSVSDSMPAISVRELRKALGDAVQAPRFGVDLAEHLLGEVETLLSLVGAARVVLGHHERAYTRLGSPSSTELVRFSS